MLTKVNRFNIVSPKFNNLNFKIEYNRIKGKLE